MHKALSTVTCYHCGTECAHNSIDAYNKHFCCGGCKTVYEILNESGLCEYYKLNEAPGIQQTHTIRKGKFAFLDNPDIVKKLVQFTNGVTTHVTFYLPQIHCSSCLWLLENINKVNSGIVSTQVNYGAKEIFIVFDATQTTLKEVVETLTHVGYEPHISLQNIQNEKMAGLSKNRIYKLGIAGFCFSNIMMLSLPEYLADDTGVEKEIAGVLKHIMVGLSLPVLSYCAAEFFTSAYKSIKQWYLNIDAPIALAILITFIRSLYEIYTNTGSGYLDSMSGIVFFMLLGRTLQDRTNHSISFDRDFKSFFPITVDVIKARNAVIPTTISDLKEKDTIVVYTNELIPADAILSKGNALIDYSFTTGESVPVTAAIGEIIYAGGRQMAGRIELVVAKPVSQSYLTGLWNKDSFKPKKTAHKRYTDLLSKYFTITVFIIGAIAAVYWLLQDKNSLMWNSLTTILIVACPCALLLAYTYTNGNILRILSNSNFYLRNADVIEDLSTITHVVFDKTGTLTENHNQHVEYRGILFSAEMKHMIAALLAQSSHPLSKPIEGFLSSNEHYTVDSFKNHTGKGIEGWVNNSHLKIGSSSFVSNMDDTEARASQVFVSCDGVVLGRFSVKNNYRSGLNEVLTELSSRYQLSILSGDNDAEALYLSKLMKSEGQLLFNQSPEQKLQYIKHLQEIERASVLMIGDGLNDAGAFKQSNVGIAITENTNAFVPACDGIAKASLFNKLPQILLFSNYGRNIIYFTFFISISYNLIGLYYAVQGILSPLIAAILMPASSLSIILLTYGLTQYYAKRLGLGNES